MPAARGAWTRWRFGSILHGVTVAWILDREYEDLMDEKVRRTAFKMGLDLRFPR